MEKEILSLVSCRTKINNIDLRLNVCDKSSGNVEITYKTTHGKSHEDLWVEHSIRFYLPNEIREYLFEKFGEILKEKLKDANR